jgi:hypothetical protein
MSTDRLNTTLVVVSNSVRCGVGQWSGRRLLTLLSKRARNLIGQIVGGRVLCRIRRWAKPPKELACFAFRWRHRLAPEFAECPSQSAVTDAAGPG